MTKLVFRPQAMDELAAIARGYEAEVRGLGLRFRRTVKQAVHLIRTHPEAYAVVVDSFRAAPLRRFPYVLLYDVDVAGIVVYAIFHTARDPESLRSRRPSG